MNEELNDAFKIARVALDSLESDVAAGRVSAEEGRARLVNVVSALRLRGRFEPERKPGNKDRGVRFNDDEVRIIASMSHYGSIDRAAEAFWGDDIEDLDSRVRQLNRIRARIEKAGLDPVVVMQTLINGD